jgi:triphosphoribosyl-dephospho-CoA synthase
MTSRAASSVSPGLQFDPALQHIGRAAVAALYDELALAPKPGLVSFVDQGSHEDMDARTFMRSLFSLRHGFVACAELGAAGADFAALEQAGIAAEARMLAATGGINTHRGAIFCLGLLCAAAGACASQGFGLSPAAVRLQLTTQWGETLQRRSAAALSRAEHGASHGADAARRFGLRSAGAEAALGFPVLFDTTWPALRGALDSGLDPTLARLQAFFATLAVLDDTNLAHRGGLGGLRLAQRLAGDYLRGGGAAADDGIERARAIHHEFVAQSLSPGGSADMLAAACWLQRVGA